MLPYNTTGSTVCLELQPHLLQISGIRNFKFPALFVSWHVHVRKQSSKKRSRAPALQKLLCEDCMQPCYYEQFLWYYLLLLSTMRGAKEVSTDRRVDYILQVISYPSEFSAGACWYIYFLFFPIKVYASSIGYTSSNANSGVPQQPKVTKNFECILKILRQTFCYINLLHKLNTQSKGMFKRV